MSKFQIFPDGRAAGSAPVSGSDFVNLDTLESSSVFYWDVAHQWTDDDHYYITVSSESLAALAEACNAGRQVYLRISGSESGSEYAQLYPLTDYANEGEIFMAGFGGTWTEGTITAYITSEDEPYTLQLSRWWMLTDSSSVWVKGNGVDSAVLRGSDSTAEGQYAVAHGYRTNASQIGSHAEGSGSTVDYQSKYAHAEGVGTKVYSSNGAHAEGYGTQVWAGSYSHAEGYQTYASKSYSHAEGYRTTTKAQGAHAEGTGSIASGSYSHTEGNVTKAEGDYSHAEGRGSRASGEGSHAEGTGSITYGAYSHAEGHRTIASGSYSHAEGSQSLASGSWSHAEGIRTLASGIYSHAEGNQATSSGTSSHAEGSMSLASGIGAHAEGYKTTASAYYSHAEGNTTVASGRGSHAEGWEVTAANQYEHAQGRCNYSNNSQIFSVGVGDHDGGYHGKNAITIITGSGEQSSASIYLYGVGGYDGTNSQPGVNDIATVISNLTGSISSASYNSTDKKIYFYNNAGTATAEVDATAFIKDGMIDTVTINTGSAQMVITFNTDAGKEDITLPLTDIFNPANYFTKDEIYAITASMDLGDHNVIEAIEFNGTASSVSNKTASINVTLPDAPNQDAENWVTENSASIVTESVWKKGGYEDSAYLGLATVAGTNGAIAHGYNVTASGYYSHAEGANNIASNNSSHVEGTNNKAYGTAAHAEGDHNEASGAYSHAEGGSNQAAGNYSHAEGNHTKATGSYSHTEGSFTATTGEHAHAEGEGTVAGGYASHTEGSYTSASINASYAHAEGGGTIASNTYEHAQGKYNATASSQIFSVGVGSAQASRKNAISVITGSGTVPSASIYIYGVGSYVGNNPQPGVNDLASVLASNSCVVAFSGSVEVDDSNVPFL